MGEFGKCAYRAGRGRMTILKPEEQQERKESFPPFEIHLLSYRLEETYYCTVDNVDPGQ